MLGFFNKIKKFNEFKAKKHAVIFSGALVFFAVLGLVPTAYLVSLCFALFNSHFSKTFEVFNFLEFLKIEDFLIETTNKLSTGGNLIAGFISIYSSANLFFHLKLTGETIYNSKKSSKILVRIFSIIGVILLSLIVTFGVVTYAFFSAYIKKYLGEILGTIINYSALFLLIFLAVLFINRFVCPYKIKFKDLLKGSVYTCVFSFLFTVVFIIYLKYFSSYDEIYGKIASIPAFLGWLFIVIRCLVTGIIINAYLKD